MVKRKILLFLSVFSLFFVIGCSDNKVDITYQQAYDTFFSNMNNWKFDIDYTKNNEFFEELDFSINSQNELANADLEIKYDAQFDVGSGKSEKIFFVKGFLDDFISYDKYDWNIDFRLNQTATGEVFLKLNRANINLGSGNIQGAFIDTILEQLIDKYVYLDNQDIDYSNYANIDYINYIDTIDMIKQNNIIMSGTSIEYDNKTAFELELNKELIIQLLSGIDEVEYIDNINAYLVANSKNDIYMVLDIEELNKTTHIEIYDNNITIEFEYGEKQYIFSLDKDLNTLNITFKVIDVYKDKEAIDLQLFASFEDRNGIKVIDFDGIIFLKELADFMQIDDIKTPIIRIDFDGIYRLNNSFTGNFINKPEEYLNLSDLLNDNFGLPYMMKKDSM